ncbi:MAG: GAF domain-containing protein [Desulfosarcina sp.]|nr:GAF domain-containing protein [Desulfosarcina sp.]MBC2742316.1 GAF domain-containing protein [Desulfosarcina sp.]MBC2765227.1 GAF domain-containing protein [Desulfosarcina sp.]
MKTVDYLSPFAEVNRVICEGANERKIMNLIARRVTETLNLKGCLIKLRSAQGEWFGRKADALNLGRSPYKVKFPEEERLELLSSFGLSEDFIYSELHESPGSMFYRIPVETIAIADIEKMKKNADYNALKAEGIRAVLAFPIEVTQERVSLVALFGDKVGELNKEDVKFAKAITSRGVISFIWLRNWDRLLDRQRQFLRSFQEISSAISSTLTINKVLELVVTKVTETLGVPGAQVRLLDPKTHQLELAQSHGLSEKFLKIGPLKAKRGKSGAQKISTKMIVINDVQTDPRVQYRSALIEEGIRKILTLPLLVRDNIIGELTIFTGETLPFSEDETQFANTIAQECAFAIHNARMYQRVRYEYQQLMVDFGYEGSS